MGHQINKPKYPKRGSRAFVPRVRAKRIYPKIKNWPKIKETKLLGFAAYKAGMAEITFVDNSKNSLTKGEEICVPVTILDVPKIKIAAIRFYKKDDRRFKKVFTEIWTDKLDKDLKRKISYPKKKKNSEEELNNIDTEKIEDITVLVYTLPKGRCNKKKPEVFEIAIGGKNIQEKFDYTKSILGNEISITDVLMGGEQIDVVAVTKGKGFQSPVKRNRIKLESKKTDRTRRGVAAIGPDVPRKVSWTIPMPGQMGFHNRYDYNKWVLKVGSDGLNIKGGFQNYGNVKKDFVILKGSIPGSAKRLVRFRFAINPSKKFPENAPESMNIHGVVNE